MFKTKVEIEMKLPTDTGMKAVVVRWPTDEEWIARNRERKIMLRGTSVERVESEGADANLFAKIKVDGSADLDQYEAGEIIDRLAVAEILDCVLGNGQAEVTLRTCQGETVHTLRIPSVQAKKKAQQAAAKLKDLPYGRRALVAYIEPMADLYDKLRVKADGYEGDLVPALHKDAAVRGLIEAVDRVITGDSENFQ